MKLGVLFSGGKDSTLALIKASKYHEIVCLITIVSDNKESFMFHTPNIEITELQARAIGIPLVRVTTKGEKEKELEDLKKAIQEAVSRYKIEGIVTGAVRSTYQASRVQKICYELGLWCFNPLWLKNQVELLHEQLDKGLKFMVTYIGAEGLDESWLGKIITPKDVNRLAELCSKTGMNPAFEGGEAESLVINAPIFNKKVIIRSAEIIMENKCTGTYQILEATLE